jgi:hypothetical protein
MGNIINTVGCRLLVTVNPSLGLLSQLLTLQKLVIHMTALLITSVTHHLYRKVMMGYRRVMMVHELVYGTNNKTKQGMS